MKKIILLLGLALSFMACSDDSGSPLQNETQNKVLLLKVDLETNVFEGGKELVFPDADGFTLTTDYNSPGDFGDITLKYEQVNDTIFAGTIVWNGTGQMTYPEALNGTDAFATVAEPAVMPTAEDFELVEYDEYSYYPEEIDYDAIWDAIDNLQLVKEYRKENPDAKVNLFLYTPSVGIGNPAEWDWYVILKN
ncbi:hypothetical protein E0W68_13365 [Flavobacterium salilacus subsp. salilacus]|uniref:hypothetical protein n=1 Tax=Flavobacterium TaxID=237 RepID=UPI001074F47B|nr:MULTISPECIES: hypothetical protein [Flavobacterium]KAF2514817.1 hypothetical protein E0W68_13365 [Flavobacterium salilacus subsp. salilacus]MBE1615461.1 hypothetical protein [Flavobacterium sp. SaA2.13]